MKFKENAIKPGMVIHCPKEENATALLKHLKELGYSWLIKGDLASINCWTRYGESTVYYLNDKKHVTFSSIINAIEIEHKTITEFSDLIEPEKDIVPEMKWEFDPEKECLEGKPASDSPTDSPMTAVEVLEWLGKHYRDEAYKEVFGYDYKFTELLRPEFSSFTVQELVDKITTYEAAKKAPKPVEVEYGKLLYVSVRNADTGLYQNYSSFEYWPDEQAESYEMVKTTFLSEVAKETQKTTRLSEYDVCRVKEGES